MLLSVIDNIDQEQAMKYKSTIDAQELYQTQKSKQISYDRVPNLIKICVNASVFEYKNQEHYSRNYMPFTDQKLLEYAKMIKRIIY